ncbi:arabinose ABC transporter substrate-binding protein [Sphingomonas koreensis]|nr:arabinose ABC transporter substrate-binding protein [Sphingomonas koreensis]
MIITRRHCLAGIGASAVAALPGCAPHRDGVRIGFIVKQPEEQWFQDEWTFAGEAARAKGFDLIRIGAEDGDRVLAAIDTLYAKYAQGFIICAPDPRLGPAILERADADVLKVMSVDDRLIGAHGDPVTAIPHVGISAIAVGTLAGTAAAEEAVRRGWNKADIGVLRIAYDSLETGRERTIGGRDALIAAGVPAANIFDAPQRTTDTEGGFTAADPLLTAHSAIAHWIILGLNDEAVLGGVRATEGLRIAARDVIGVGIGGSETAIAEFSKAGVTGFYASVLLSPRAHGYDTAVAMYDWIAHGRRPAPVTYTTGTLITRANFRAVVAREAA